MKKKILIPLMLVLTLTLVASGIVFAAHETENITTPEEKLDLVQPRVVDVPTVGMVFVDMTSESSQRNKFQAEIEFEQRGWESSIITDAQTADLQRDAMSTLIQKDVDAIIIIYATMERLTDQIIQARERGIGVYCIDTELRPGVVYNPTQANGVAGGQVFYWGMEEVNRKGQVLISTISTHFGVRQRTYATRGLITNEWPLLQMAGYEVLPVPGWDRAAFDVAQNYITRYGEDLKWLYGGWDMPAVIGSRALMQQGYYREDIIATGIDGGTEAWSQIRDTNTPFCATLSQPFEQYTHMVFEMIDEIQVQGIPIGHPDSTLPESRTHYVSGPITDESNVPEPNVNVHEFYKDTYYDPDDTEAWYNWGEPYIIGEQIN